MQGSDNDDMPSPARPGDRSYGPVVAHDNDPVVLEMSSFDPGSSSKANHPLKRVKTRQPNMGAGGREESVGANGVRGESKLELFGFDSLVNILGLKSMTGEQSLVSNSPRSGEHRSTAEQHPKMQVRNEVKFGTMMGVFIPCLQNILGIIYYIRFSWIVGIAGISQSLLLVSLCGLCTFLTAVSLSAIATNGAMKGGGPYYLIGRALGPEVGVSIGLCFFLGNAIAGAIGDISNCCAKSWDL